MLPIFDLVTKERRVGEVIASQVRIFIGTSSFEIYILVPPRFVYNSASVAPRGVKV